MKRTIIAIILAGLLLLMMPIAVSAASGVTVVDRAGDGEWTDNTWQVEIYPGETKATTIKLYNSSSSSLEVEVSVLPDSLDGGNLTFELDEANFTMPGRSSTDVTLSVKANGSTTPGTYTAELEIKSEVAPTPGPIPPQPTPPELEVEEPEEEEPIEPVVVEPTEPVEPEVDISEEEEPIEESIEPIEPLEPEEPVEPEDLIPIEEPCRWSLLDSILASLVAIMLGLDIWQWRKQRA